MFDHLLFLILNYLTALIKAPNILTYFGLNCRENQLSMSFELRMHFLRYRDHSGGSVQLRQHDFL